MPDPRDDTGPGKRPQTTTTSAGEKDPGRATLPAPFGARGHGDAPETVRKDGHRRVLVVHEWRAAVKTSSVHTVPSWTEQRRRLWKDVGEACEWEHPRAPSVKLLWDVRAAGAVLEFLRTTRVGCIGVGRILPEGRGEETDGEEGGPGPP